MDDVYYNDNDPKVVKRLGFLMRRGLISKGEIDGRSIKEIPDDHLVSRRRVHLFAGIAGFELALQLAGWGGRTSVDRQCPMPTLVTSRKTRWL